MAAEVVTRTEKDSILMNIGDCAVTILPQFGGKISSILVKGHELLQIPLAPYGPRTRTAIRYVPGILLVQLRILRTRGKCGPENDLLRQGYRSR